MIKVTDYERIAVVNVNQHGQFECPKCHGICNKNHDLWDCNKCGRGWEQIQNHIMRVNDLFRDTEEALERTAFEIGTCQGCGHYGEYGKIHVKNGEECGMYL